MPKFRKPKFQELPPQAICTAIHIGASAVSMLVAEKNQNHSLVAIDFLEQPIQLGSDLFRYGAITQPTIERIVTIIHGFQRTLSELGLSPFLITRAAAINILHEARNHDEVINRIQIACQIPFDIIDDGEMTRLIYLKTRRRLNDLPTMKQDTALVIHIGPGNTRALLFHNGKIIRYTNYRMGTLRTHEAVDATHAEGTAIQRVIREHVFANISQIRFDYASENINHIVAIGPEIQAVAASIAHSKKSTFSLKQLRECSASTSSMIDVDIVKRFGIDFQSAEALLPALEINIAIAEHFKLPEIHIPISTYEQGLLHDLLVSRTLSGAFNEDVLHSAKILASKYQSHPDHAEHVGNLCSFFFNELQDLHQLGPHEHLLLQVASILHEVGTYISPRAHQIHSEYIILNSEVFGLDRKDVTIVAQIARYHRQESPTLDHPGYAALNQNDRIRVCKLAAILRVADALERTHAQRVGEIKITRDKDKIRLKLPGLKETGIEKLALDSKADLFHRTFGLAVTIDDTI